MWVLVSLKDLGPKAAAALTEVREELKNPDDELRSDAVRAFGAIGGPVNDLLPLLSDGSHKVRLWTVRTLETMGPKARAAKPALYKILHDPDSSEELRRATRVAIAQIGEN
jgi:HEAT repeat protein